MTDNEMIKALKHCLTDLDCLKCPYVDHDGKERCDEKLFNDLCDLINRQKAEIERLQSDLSTWKDIAHRETSYVSIVKAEAVKEFAERLNKEAENVCIDREGDFVETDDKIYDTVANWCRAISDKLSKEMVGADNG